jgi:hypothetical protein
MVEALLFRFRAVLPILSGSERASASKSIPGSDALNGPCYEAARECFSLTTHRYSTKPKGDTMSFITTKDGTKISR